MDDFYITGIKREKKFEASSKSFTVYVKLDENNNKISYIFYNIDLDGFRWSKGLRPTDDMFEFFIDRIFELMIFKNVYIFKNLLSIIKDSEHEFYKKGIDMLQNKKKELLKEAEKYSF